MFSHKRFSGLQMFGVYFDGWAAPVAVREPVMRQIDPLRHNSFRQPLKTVNYFTVFVFDIIFICIYN